MKYKGKDFDGLTKTTQDFEKIMSNDQYQTPSQKELTNRELYKFKNCVPMVVYNNEIFDNLTTTKNGTIFVNNIGEKAMNTKGKFVYFVYVDKKYL